MAESELVEKLNEIGKDNIKFVKYHFVDMQGNIRELTLSRGEVKGKGYSSTDGSSVFGKIIPPTESDMLLVPDIETVALIPWEKDSARVICDVYYPPESDGAEPKPFEGCPRGVLSKVEMKSSEMLKLKLASSILGWNVKKIHAHFAPEMEFILLPGEYDINKIYRDSGLKNNNYFMVPDAKTNAALKEMTESLSMLNMKKEKFHTEVTTYQCEIGIGHGNIKKMADAVMTVRYLIKTIAEKHGLKASFIPKFRTGVNGSGMHVHQNLAVTLETASGNKEERNLFFDSKKESGLSDIGQSYIEGLLAYAREITALTNSSPISYKRLVPGCEAPTYIAWDWKNRTALCRGAAPNTSKIRVEYRAPDPLCNPYLAFAAMLSAGAEGISKGLKLRKNDTRNLYHENSGVIELPGNYGESLELMMNSEMLNNWMGKDILKFVHYAGSNLWKSYPWWAKNKTVMKEDIKRFF